MDLSFPILLEFTDSTLRIHVKLEDAQKKFVFEAIQDRVRWFFVQNAKPSHVAGAESRHPPIDLVQQTVGIFLDHVSNLHRKCAYRLTCTKRARFRWCQCLTPVSTLWSRPRLRRGHSESRRLARRQPSPACLLAVLLHVHGTAPDGSQQHSLALQPLGSLAVTLARTDSDSGGRLQHKFKLEAAGVLIGSQLPTPPRAPSTSSSARSWSGCRVMRGPVVQLENLVQLRVLFAMEAVR